MNKYKYQFVPLFYLIISSLSTVTAYLFIEKQFGFHGGSSEPPTCGTYDIFLKFAYVIIPILSAILSLIFTIFLLKIKKVKLKLALLIKILVITFATFFLSVFSQFFLPMFVTWAEPGLPAFWCPELIYIIFITFIIPGFIAILFAASFKSEHKG